MLPAPGLAHGGDMDPSKLSKVIKFARRQYRWVVLDLGRLGSGNLALAEQTDEVILATTDSIASLHAAKRAVEALGVAGVERERVHLLVNRGDEAAEALPTSELVKLFGVEVCARLPYAGAELCRALVNRKLPPASSAFRSGLRNVARKLLGLEETKPKRMIPGLVSFLSGDKNRKPVPGEATASAGRPHA